MFVVGVQVGFVCLFEMVVIIVGVSVLLFNWLIFIGYMVIEFLFGG